MTSALDVRDLQVDVDLTELPKRNISSVDATMHSGKVSPTEEGSNDAQLTESRTIELKLTELGSNEAAVVEIESRLSGNVSLAEKSSIEAAMEETESMLSGKVSPAENGSNEAAAVETGSRLSGKVSPAEKGSNEAAVVETESRLSGKVFPSEKGSMEAAMEETGSRLSGKVSPAEKGSIEAAVVETGSTLSGKVSPAGKDSIEAAVVETESRFSRIITEITNPDSPTIRVWNWGVIVAIVIACILAMFMAAFDSSPRIFWAVVYICDIVNIVDIFNRFFLVFKDEIGVPNKDRKTICNRYLKGEFLFDLISVLPIEILSSIHIPGIAQGHRATILRLNRIVRFWRVTEFFEKKADELGSNTSILRAFKYTIVCLLSTHGTTCLWFAFACDGIHEYGQHIQCSEGTWAKNKFFDIGFDIEQVNSAQAYVLCLYWSVATATSTGYGDISAVSISEHWLSIVAMLMGVALYFGMLLGGMASMLTNFDQPRADYVHKFQSIKEHLAEEAVSENLQHQIISYYEYFWARKKGVQMEGVYDMLPITFQAEICSSINNAILRKASLFTRVSEGFLRMLSMKIHYLMCLPGQMIVNKGELGHQMFFIHKGEVQILSEADNMTPIVTLNAGKIFGEYSLLYPLPRAVSVRAKTHCDLLVLDREDMEPILNHYPEIRSTLVKSAKARILEKSDPKSPDLKEKGKSKSTNALFMRKKNLKSTTEEQIDEYGNIILDNDHLATIETKFQKTRTMITDLLKNGTINPNSVLARRWHLTILFVIVIICIIYPYMAFYTTPAFRYGYFDTSFGIVLLTATYIFDIILLLDIFINMRMEIVTEHETVTSLPVLQKRYLHSTKFLVDIVSVLPIEICFLGSSIRHSVFPFLKLNRLFKFFQIPKVFGYLEVDLNTKVENVRTGKFLLYVVILTHLWACALYAAACHGKSCTVESWFGAWAEEHLPANVTVPSPVVDYIVSLYFAAVTSTSTGYGDLHGKTTTGRLVMLTIMLLGLLLYGYALSVMAATLATGDSIRVYYQGKLLAIKAFMHEHKLSSDMHSRVIDYLCILWDKHNGVWVPGMPSLTHDAPVALQNDMAREIVCHTLEMCPLFTNTDVHFLRSLALKAHTFLFRPGEKISYAGDPAFQMYLIRRGYGEIRTPDLKTMLCQIGPDQYFGDLDMLFGEYNQTSVVARTSVEVLEITKTDLYSILDEFPLVKKQFDEITQNKDLYSRFKNELFEQYPSLIPDKSSSQKELARRSELILQEHEGNTFVRDAFKAKGLMSFYNCSPQIKEEYDEGVKDMPLYGRILRYGLMRAALNPMNKDLKICASFIMLLSIIQGFVVPLNAAFFPRNWPMLVFLYVLDFGHFCNMYLRSHLAYFNEAEVVFVTHPMYTAHNYLYTNFLVDLFGTFPYELFILFGGIHFYEDHFALVVLLRLTRLIHLYRLPLATSHVEGSVARTTGSVRSVKFFLYVTLFSNFAACMTYIVAAPPYVGDVIPDYLCNETGFVKGSWIFGVLDFAQIDKETAAQSKGLLYIISLYWATATSLNVGYGDIHAVLPGEMVLSLMIMIMGLVFYAYLIASVTAGMTNADTQRGIFADKLIAIKAFMNDHNVDESIRNRILAHYNHLYIRTKGIDPKSLFDALPQSLWGDLSLSLYEDIVSKISLFKDTDPPFIKMVCKTIKQALYLRGEYIVRKHDIGDEMFFVHSGVVEVVSEDGYVVFDTMTVGQAFGEVALLFDCPRTASIRAKTNCDLFVLTKKDLDLALSCYPNVKANMEVIANERRDQARQRSYANARKSLANLTPDELHDLRTSFGIPEESGNINDEQDGRELVSGEEHIGMKEHMASGLNWLIDQNNFTILPENKLLKTYEGFMCIIGILSCFLVIYQAMYQDHHMSVIILNYSCDFFFVIDIYLKFHTSFYTAQGKLIDSYLEVSTAYLKDIKGGFVRDAIGTFPLSIFSLLANKNQQLFNKSMLRIPHLLRFFFVTDYFANWEKQLDTNMMALRLCQSVMYLLMSSTLFSGIWYALACPPWYHGACYEISWIKHTKASMVTSFDKFCVCLYWCTASMTSTGYGDEHAYNTSEMVFSTLVMLGGKLIFGFILATISSALQNAEANRINYDGRLNGIKSNMVNQQVPKPLRKRVVDYFGHLWVRTKGVEIKNLFEDCPKCLLAELKLHITRPMLETIPLFEDADESFLRQICLHVSQIMFLPEDVIIKKGDAGTGLMYIHRGVVDIVSEDNPPKALDVLREGQIFGEVSLISNVPRKITAIARTHVDVFILSKQNLEEVLYHYPVLKENMDKASSKRFGAILKELKSKYDIKAEHI